MVLCTLHEGKSLLITADFVAAGSQLTKDCKAAILQGWSLQAVHSPCVADIQYTVHCTRLLYSYMHTYAIPMPYLCHTYAIPTVCHTYAIHMYSNWCIYSYLLFEE